MRCFLNEGKLGFCAGQRDTAGSTSPSSQRYPAVLPSSLLIADCIKGNKCYLCVNWALLHVKEQQFLHLYESNT